VDGLAPALVGTHGRRLTSSSTSSHVLPQGRPFYKMSGSGNDFVVVDAMKEAADSLMAPRVVQALCARATGIGADGLVVLEPSKVADFRMTYLNSDGSRADLCGNASLCSSRLASELGIIGGGGFHMETDAGVLAGSFVETGPEVELQPVSDVQLDLPFRLAPGEHWMGFSLAGVPHLVVRVEDVSTVDVVGRGRPLRHESAFSHGANVNFVSPDGSGGWRMRTYERGVEGETLACGTGSVATAILLTAKGEAKGPVALTTRSGKVLRVKLRREGAGWIPALSGEARIVFQGILGEL
jgi:diaminopimelate epimerase